ncbi:MAG: N-6 DNA methylase, partial [Cellulomonadaceae bacterium]|nr:N-6 DNA methylase [Cellulomonadaceae bacterium]
MSDKKALGQYFTPASVAKLMVGMLKARPADSILEPSCGAGVFLTELHNAGYKNVHAVEIDDSLEFPTCFPVEVSSFVSWQAPKKFAAVIGNPPYIRWKNLDFTQQDEVKRHHLWGTLFNSLSDYLTIFIANAVLALESGGELIFITPSFWLGTQHSAKLRNWLLGHGGFSDLVEFGESQVFEGVASHIVIFRFIKGTWPDQINLHRYIGGRKVPENITLGDATQFRKELIPPFRPSQHWTIATAEKQSVANSLE